MMWFYSLHQLLEIGSYEQCQQAFGDQADFVVLSANITHLIGIARMGLCLPRECKQHHYDAFTTTSVDLVNKILAKLIDKANYHPTTGLVRDFTRVGLTLTKSDDYTQDWHERTYEGMVAAAILISTIILIIGTVNVYQFYVHMRDPKRYSIFKGFATS